MGRLIDIDSLLTITSAARELGFTTSWVTQLIGRGDLQVILVDGKKFITTEEIKRYQKQQQESQEPVAA